jgi:hypothetical protein
MDEYANRHIKMTKNAIKFGSKIQSRSYSNSIRPIQAKDINPSVEPFATLDIETVNSPINPGEQLPIAITTTYPLGNNKINTKIFLIEPKLFIRSPNFAINKL